MHKTHAKGLAIVKLCSLAYIKMKERGRQLLIATTELDNQLFQEYLKDNYEYVIIMSFAPTKETLFIEDLQSEFKYDSFHIWNKEFQWEPTFEQVGHLAVNQTMIGYYYVSNIYMMLH